MARLTKKQKQEQLALAQAETKVIPLWQLRCAQSAMRKFERSGSGTDLFPACKLIAPDKRWDTPTMAARLDELLVANADRLAVRQ